VGQHPFLGSWRGGEARENVKKQNRESFLKEHVDQEECGEESPNSRQKMNLLYTLRPSNLFQRGGNKQESGEKR